MRRLLWFLILFALLPWPVVRAQDSPFPLPAPLYILTSEQRVLRVDPATGGQTIISPEGQPVADFAISPDGNWYVYRSPANNAVIVTQIEGGSGYVLEFDVPVPDSGPARTIGWAPDASAIAYIVPGGLRVAELGADPNSAPVFSTLQGPWVEFYWESPESLIATDANGSATRISGQAGGWTVEAAPGADAQAQMAVRATLAPSGVMLADNTVVPGTAGALAFAWSPLPLPVVEGVVMPRDLYYVAGAAGVDQVWRLPASGQPPAQVTSANDPILGYAVAPQGVAYVAGGQLWVLPVEGGSPRAVGMLALDYQRPRPGWSADGTHIAYHDARGLWIVPADGSQPPQMLVENQAADAQTAPAAVRVYLDPRWSPDGSRLLVTIGLYEGAMLGVIDVASGAVTVLEGLGVAEAVWTPDNQVLAWSAHAMYGIAGLFLIDPDTPAAPLDNLVPQGTPVVDIAQGADGRWYALVTHTSEMGPQYVRAWVSDSLGDPFAPLYGAESGGFAQEPELAAPGNNTSATAAGFEQVSYDATANGPLVVLDLQNSSAVRVQGAEAVRDIQWGP